MFQLPVPDKPPRGGARPGEEEVSHAGDPTQELRAGTSRCRKSQHSPSARDGGILQNPRRSNYRSNTDQIDQTSLPSSGPSVEEELSYWDAQPAPKL